MLKLYQQLNSNLSTNLNPIGKKSKYKTFYHLLWNFSGPGLTILIIILLELLNINFINISSQSTIFCLILIYSFFSGGIIPCIISAVFFTGYSLFASFITSSALPLSMNILVSFAGILLVWFLQRCFNKSHNEVANIIQQLFKFQAISPAASVYTSLDGDILYVHPKFCNLLGYTEEELIGLTSIDVTHPEDASVSRKIFNKMYEEKTSTLYLEKRYIRKDGQEIWANICISFISDAMNNPIGFLTSIHDLTNIKKAGENLRREDEVYRSLFHNNNLIIILIDPETAEIIDANPFTSNFYGYTKEQLLSMKISDIAIDPEGESMDIASLTSSSYHHFIAQSRLSSGEIRDLEVYCSVINVHDKKLLYTINFDITDRKLTKKALEKSEQKYRALFNYTNDAIYLNEVKEDGTPCTFMEINDEACKRTGFTRMELLNSTPYDVYHKDCLHLIPKYFIELIKKKSLTFELTTVTKNGTNIPVELSSHLVEIDGKNFALSISRDITERKIAEKALRQSEERYRKLVEISPEAIFVHTDSKLVFTNEAGLKLLGYSNLNELLGKPITETFHSSPQILNMLSSIEKRIKSSAFIADKIIRTDNQIIDVDITSTFFYYEEKPSVLSFVRNISDRVHVMILEKNIEESKKQLNEILEYEKLKIEFFSNISHELKTPLNLILSTLQLFRLYIQSNVISENNSKINKHLDIMKQNCYRLLRLVNNIIDITRIDTDFFDVQFKNYNIVNIIEDLTLSVQEYVENHSIKLNFQTEIPEKIIACDPNLIERIMLNLLSNAVKFTKPGGSISVSICDNKDSVFIYVEDTGIGIPVKQFNIIFERFRQVDKSFTRSHEGSGIGLSLVKSLVEMHGGNISVESHEGSGSKFIIELPVKNISDEDLLNQNEIISDNFESIDIEFSDL